MWSGVRHACKSPHNLHDIRRRTRRGLLGYGRGDVEWKQQHLPGRLHAGHAVCLLGHKHLDALLHALHLSASTHHGCSWSGFCFSSFRKLWQFSCGQFNRPADRYLNERNSGKHYDFFGHNHREYCRFPQYGEYLHQRIRSLCKWWAVPSQY